MVGGRAVKGVRQRVAPLAQRDLAAEIDADAVEVRRVLLRDLVWGTEEHSDAEGAMIAERTVIARVDATTKPAVDAWLHGADGQDAALDVRTDWIFFPSTPEAVLMVVAEDATSGTLRFRVNVRFAADPYRRHLETLVRTGVLGLTTIPLQIDENRRLLSPCVFVPVQQESLRAFLREIPATPVV
jgi:hypothetical protein